MADSYNPNNDPANPDKPKDAQKGAGTQEGTGNHAHSEAKASSPNPDPAEGNITGLEPGGVRAHAGVYGVKGTGGGDQGPPAGVLGCPGHGKRRAGQVE